MNRKKPLYSTQSLIPVKSIISSVIITEDDRFIKLMEILPVNYQMKSIEEKSQIIAGFERVLKIAPSNIQLKVICMKANINSYLDTLQKEMENEDNYECYQMQLEYGKLLKTIEEDDSISRRFFMAFEYENEDSTRAEQAGIEEKISWCNNMASRIKTYLKQCGNEVVEVDKAYDNNQVAEILYTVLNRRKAQTMDFNDYACSIYQKYNHNDLFEERYVPTNEYIAPANLDFTHSDYLICDGRYYMFCYITSDGYCTQVSGGWTDMLINICSGIDVDIYLKRISSEAIRTKIKRSLARNNLNMESISSLDNSYEKVSGSTESGIYFIKGLQQGYDFYYMSIMMTVIADSQEELQWKYKEIKKYLNSYDISIRDCRYENEEAFISSLPLCRLNSSINKKARRNLLISSAAACYPFSCYEMMDEDGILLGKNMTNGSLAILNIFNTRKYSNANIFITGTTGSGKTYALLLLAMRMRLKKIPVYILAPEKQHEFMRVTAAVGGQYIQLGVGTSHHINIMEISQKDDRASRILDNPVESSCLLEKIADIKSFMKLLIDDISYEEKQLIDECLIRTYREKGITEDNESLIDSTTGHYKEMPVFSDFYHQMEKEEKLQRIKNISREIVNGSLQFFNGQTNVDLNNDFTVIGLQGLSEDILPATMFSAVNYIWSKVRENRIKRKAVFIDEYWRFAYNETALNFTIKMIKTIRAYGGSLVLATQQINDIYGLDNSKTAEGVLNNCKIKIILKVEEKDGDNLQYMLHLSDDERRRIIRYRQGEGLLTVNGNNIDIKFTSSPTEHSLITTDRMELEKMVEEIQNQSLKVIKDEDGKEKVYIEVDDTETIMRLERKQ